VIDWSSAAEVATTGIVSVFLVLGILNIAVYLAGIYFSSRDKAEERGRGASSS